ncbi:MAG: RsmE family RNA methyltransferase [Ignavibacteria bacterium]|nr:RsmE family RNA methyltransferase [Ignavibacteria bacterium]
MEYYYTKPEDIDEKNSKLEVKGYDYKHLARVLRKKTGDKLKITDGKRNIYTSEIVEIKSDSLKCRILSKSYNLFEPKEDLKLFTAPLRNQDRFEFLIEKAVELGVSSIYPVITQNCIVKAGFSANKMERMRKIIISAMGQSQRCLLPEFHETIDFEEMINITNSMENKIVFYEFADEESKFGKGRDQKAICSLIGPEGGFTEREIDTLKEKNWQVCSLGGRKMRAETAAIISVYEILNHK